ncbi:hypothetical protein ACLKOZ_00095 [Arthrobacter sp. R4]|jgi:hypothetical protein
MTNARGRGAWKTLHFDGFSPNVPARRAVDTQLEGPPADAWA